MIKLLQIIESHVKTIYKLEFELSNFTRRHPYSEARAMFYEIARRLSVDSNSIISYLKRDRTTKYNLEQAAESFLLSNKLFDKSVREAVVQIRGKFNELQKS